MKSLFLSFILFLQFLFFSLATEVTAEASDDESSESTSGGLCFDNHVSLSAEQIDENERNRLGDDYIRPGRRLNPYVPQTEEDSDDYIISTEEDYLSIYFHRDKNPLVEESNPSELLDLHENTEVQRAQRYKLIFYVTLLCILFGIVGPILTYYVHLTLQ